MNLILSAVNLIYNASSEVQDSVMMYSSVLCSIIDYSVDSEVDYIFTTKCIHVVKL